MNIKLTNGLLGLAALLLAGQVNAATVFAPTDADINVLNSNLMSGSILAMFDDTDQLFALSSLTITPPEVVGIGTSGGGNWLATNFTTAATLVLTGSDQFIFGVSNDGGNTWMGDTSVVNNGANSITIGFADGSVLAVDVRVVPVPAAVWLFGSGLIGLVGIARRKKA